MSDEGRRRRRREPTLAVQIVLFLTAALIFSVGANALVLSGDRSLAARIALRAQLAEQFAAAARHARDEDAALGFAAFRPWSSRRMTLWLGRRDLAAGASLDDPFVDTLRKTMAEAGFDAPVSARRVDGGAGGLRRVLAARRDRPARLDPPPPTPPAADGGRRLMVAVEIAPGRHLHAALAPPPGARPSARALLSISFVAICVAAAGLFFARRIAAPLSALADAAERFGRGEEAGLDDVRGPREIGRAIDAFERMQDRVTRLIADQRRVIGAVGHDLRTPLAGMRIRLENLDPGADRDKLVAAVEEMNAMCEALLAWSRDASAEEATRRVDLADLLDSLAEDYRDLGRPVSYEGAGAAVAPLACRPASLKRAVRNLVDNALRYAGASRIALLEEDGEVVVRVDDDGPGMSEADISGAFEPFRRGEGSRNRATGGAGLGLAVVRSVAQSHGGDARLENRPEGGLRAEIRLPRGG